MNTIGSGLGGASSNGYVLSNVVEPSLPFSLSITARVTASEGPDPPWNVFGFSIAVYTGTGAFQIGLATRGSMSGAAQPA